MSGHMFAIGSCFSCGAPFTFDPDTVPSIPIDPETNLPPDLGDTPPERAVKQPVCPVCVTEANRQRALVGLPPIRVTGEYS